MKVVVRDFEREPFVQPSRSQDRQGEWGLSLQLAPENDLHNGTHYLLRIGDNQYAEVSESNIKDLLVLLERHFSTVINSETVTELVDHLPDITGIAFYERDDSGAHGPFATIDRPRCFIGADNVSYFLGIR